MKGCKHPALLEHSQEKSHPHGKAVIREKGSDASTTNLAHFELCYLYALDEREGERRNDDEKAFHVLLVIIAR